MAKTIGSYKGVPIIEGNDASIKAQMAAIDSKQSMSTSSNAGDANVKKLQASLGVPVTGIMDTATTTAMNAAVSNSLKSNPNYAGLIGSNNPDALAAAYTSGNWSGVTDLTGKPFTDQQQQEAVTEAEKALSPAYNAQVSYDTSNVESGLQKQKDQFANFLTGEARDFTNDKKTLDQGSADNGVLFAGSRTEKERNLKKLYEDRQNQQFNTNSNAIVDLARGYQYKYGNENANKLSSYYTMPAGNTYNSSVANGSVTPNTSIKSIYNPSTADYQGTAVTAQKAAVQTRAADLLKNTANKLTPTGYKNKY